MENLKLILSIISLVVTAITVTGGYFYVKFQTAQNTKDIAETKQETRNALTKIEDDIKKEIEKISVEIRSMRIVDESRTGDIYNLIRVSGEKIIEKIDEVKRDFVSKQMCSTITHKEH